MIEEASAAIDAGTRITFTVGGLLAVAGVLSAFFKAKHMLENLVERMGAAEGKLETKADAKTVARIDERVSSVERWRYREQGARSVRASQDTDRIMLPHHSGESRPTPAED